MDGGSVSTANDIRIGNTAFTTDAGIQTLGDASVSGPGAMLSSSNSLSVGKSGGVTLMVSGQAEVSSDTGVIGGSNGDIGTVTITDNLSTWATSEVLTVGDAGNGTLNVESGALVDSDGGVIGNSSSGTGTATVTGSNSQWNVSEALVVGNQGNGTLNVAAGGLVSVRGNSLGSIGRIDGTGIANVTGSNSRLNVADSLVVGDEGQGTLNIEAGGRVSSNEGSIAGSSSESAPVDNGIGTATVTGAGSQWVVSRDLIVGELGEGSLNIEAGGVVTNASGLIGDRPDSDGAVTVTGSGSQWNNSGSLSVGIAGNATLDILDGGVVTSSGAARIGAVIGTGDVEITDDGSQWNHIGELIVGDSASGSLEILSGAHVSATSMSLAVRGPVSGLPPADGALRVAGIDSVLTLADDLVVGSNGVATVSVEDGGYVSTSDGFIGREDFGDGVVTVTGTGSHWEASGDLTVSNRGQGTLNIEAGGAVSSQNGTVGTSGVGVTTVTGTGSRWNLSRDLTVGTFGNGTLNIQDGGVVSSAGGDIGEFSGGVGVVSVSGSGSQWNNSDLMFVGNSGTGTLNILNGGSIVGTTLNLGKTSGLTGFGNVTAPVFGSFTADTINATGALFLGDGSSAGYDFAGTLNVGGNRVDLLDADAANLGILTTLASGGELNAAAGLILDAGEQITASGDALIRGALNHNGAVTGPTAAGESLTFNDDVTGPGSFAGNITFNQTYSPGSSPAEVDFGGGRLNLVTTSTLELEIFGPTPGSEYDRITNIDDVAIGGMLRLIFDGYTPAGGTVFDFLGFDTFLFSFDKGSQLEVTGFDAALLDFTQFTTTGRVRVIPEPATLLLVGAGAMLIGVSRRRNESGRLLRHRLAGPFSSLPGASILLKSGMTGSSLQAP